LVATFPDLAGISLSINARHGALTWLFFEIRQMATLVRFGISPAQIQCADGSIDYFFGGADDDNN
jgi:hypothetical protein